MQSCRLSPCLFLVFFIFFPSQSCLAQSSPSQTIAPICQTEPTTTSEVSFGVEDPADDCFKRVVTGSESFTTTSCSPIHPIQENFDACFAKLTTLLTEEFEAALNSICEDLCRANSCVVEQAGFEAGDEWCSFPVCDHEITSKNPLSFKSTCETSYEVLYVCDCAPAPDILEMD